MAEQENSNSPWIGVPPAGVASFNGRTGVVTPQAGDYSSSQVGALSPSAVGAPGGVASLGSSGALPLTQLPSTVVTADATGHVPARQIPQLQPWLGMNANHITGYGAQNLYSNLGMPYTRILQQQGQTLDESGNPLMTDIATIASLGQIPVIILSPSTYGGGTYITGGAIASYAAWFVSQVQTIQAAYPIGALYEIDNEPWGFYSPDATAAQYADVVVAVLNAAQAANLNLSSIYAMVQNPAWLSGMYTEQPTLETLVQGWSVHPYGAPPPGCAQSITQGIASVPFLRKGMASGANNILISEVGFWTPDVNGGSGGSYGEPSSAPNSTTAAQWLTATLQLVQQYRQAGWLTACLIYHRSAGGWAMNLSGGTLTAQGQVLIGFPQQVTSQENSTFTPGSPGIWMPADDGFAAATMDPATAGGVVSMGSGRIYFFRVRLDTYQYLQYIMGWIDNGTTPVLTGSENFAGIYQPNPASSTYTLVASTADETTNWTAMNRQTMTLTSGVSLSPGPLWVALLQNGSTTAKWRGQAVGDQLNLGNNGALPQRVMYSGTGNTSLPSTINLGSGSVVGSFTAGVCLAIA